MWPRILEQAGQPLAKILRWPICERNVYISVETRMVGGSGSPFRAGACHTQPLGSHGGSICPSAIRS